MHVRRPSRSLQPVGTPRCSFGVTLRGGVYCGVWMIDFSKARPAKAPLTHIADRQLGNQEDGYLFGLTNMIRVWEGISVEGV